MLVQPPPSLLRHRISGEEATGEEKGLVDLWIVGEGFAGQSDRDPYEQLAGCRRRQDEEAKKHRGRDGNTDPGDFIITARDRREVGCDAGAGWR